MKNKNNKNNKHRMELLAVVLLLSFLVNTQTFADTNKDKVKTSRSAELTGKLH